MVILTLPDLAEKHGLTNYDAAYLELAIRRNIALATTDQALRRAATRAGVPLANVT
jgi:predicted nucleic acid-binding protein